ncbi:MAG: phosphoribosylamine--glycine ligase [Cyanobacteria bacterium REEB67]|nr:phosphoribosylamine--glycine ligase [Cyanobacteria bacterium REEB67]
MASGERLDKVLPGNILIVGGGGREHALAWKLAQSPAVKSIYCAPGNGGTALMPQVKNLPLAVGNFEGIAAAALEHKIDLVIVGPDNPLADGIVDFLQERGLTVFGPTRTQAKLEWSKTYAKEQMAELGLPTARFYSSRSLEDALAFVRDPNYAWARVIKADGLALGKGVFVCDSVAECEEALTSIFGGSFGDAGDMVVIEEKLVGEELSLLCVSDGKTLLELGCAQDHKRRFAADQGPNTGGMGAYSPVPLYEDAADSTNAVRDNAVRERIRMEVLEPIGKALADGRLSFKGVLFIGIMVAGGVPYILEFNARLGDPETQTILPRLRSDLLPVLAACTDGTLAGIKLDWSPLKSVCVSVVAKEYPAKSSNGEIIELDEPVGQFDAADIVAAGALIFHAGTKLASDGKLTTAGGRVFSAVGLAPTMEAARELAHRAIDGIHFDCKDFRCDIGWRALEQCASK